MAREDGLLLMEVVPEIGKDPAEDVANDKGHH